jgi:methylphosphotriester-DNA--protein-cysteine methyltransferase
MGVGAHSHQAIQITIVSRQSCVQADWLTAIVRVRAITASDRVHRRQPGGRTLNRRACQDRSNERISLRRQFKIRTGVTPHQYVLERRVELAKRLLLEHHLSIADVANVCGFATQPHLTTIFSQACWLHAESLPRLAGFR